MGSMGLGSVLDQLEDLKLGELLDTPPPGLDEAIAITKVVQFIKSDDYSKFSRIVFDTAPTVSPRLRCGAAAAAAAERPGALVHAHSAESETPAYV